MAPVSASLRRVARRRWPRCDLYRRHPKLIVGGRHGAPLAVSDGEDEMFVRSDARALALLTGRIVYLQDGDWAVVGSREAMY